MTSSPVANPRSHIPAPGPRRAHAVGRATALPATGAFPPHVAVGSGGADDVMATAGTDDGR